MLIEDYISDLSHLPAIAIDRACKQYRRDPQSQFFPKVGVLLELATKTCTDERRDLKGLANMLRLIDDDRERLGYEPQRPTAEEFENLTRSLADAAVPKPPVDMPTYDRQYFESRRGKTDEQPTKETAP